MYTLLMVGQVVVAIALVALILLQHGKGADAGAAFGAGASGTVFGSRGTANFLSRSTAALAAVFMTVSLTLAYLVHDQTRSRSIVDEAGDPVPIEQPAAPEERETPRIPE